MDRYTFYSKRSNYLLHSDEYGKKHYQKIDNYYGPGKARYFWSKEEWDAYQKEKEGMYQKAKDDVAKRDDYNKNMQAAKQAGADRAAKETDSNRIKEIQKKISESNDSEEIYDIVRNTKEVQDYLNYLKKYAKEAYNKGEIHVGQDDLYNSIALTINDAKRSYGKDPIENYRSSMHSSSFISGLIMTELSIEVKDYIDSLIKVDEVQNERYKQEQNNIRATYESAVNNKDINAVTNIINIELDSYWSKKRVTVDDTIEIDDYLSDLRELEEKSPEGIPLKQSATSIEEDMKWINYQRKNGDAIENGDGNCRLCSLCIDLRQRGYDVSAANANDFDNRHEKFAKGTELYETNARKFSWETEYEGKMKNANKDTGIGEFYKNIENATVYAVDLINDPDADMNKIMSKHKGESGIMDVSWKNADYGHAVYWQVTDTGEFIIYDAQINQKKNWDDYKDNVTNYVSFVRTDNLEVDFENLKKKGYIIYE